MTRFHGPHVLAIGTSGVFPCFGPEVSLYHVATLLDGYALAVQRLSADTPTRPTLLLLDLHTQEPDFPEFAAPQLIAVLARQMTVGDLHPAWLVGLTDGSSPELEAEARIAGCHQLLRHPCSPLQIDCLQDLSTQPAPLPYVVGRGRASQAIQAYQRAAERVLRGVQAAHAVIWTADDVRVLLGALTRYPSPTAAPARIRRIMRALGGADPALQSLHAIADAWRIVAPLYAEILLQFLEGWERKEIVSYFVSRHLYDERRVVSGITKLPERIAQEFRHVNARENGMQVPDGS